MAEPVKLTAPRIRVVLDAAGDGTLTEYEVQTDNRDAVRWDMTRGREHWPAMMDAPMLWATFMAWSAMNRAGDFTGTFTQFNEHALEASAIRDEAGDMAEVGPTRAAPEPL